MRAYIAMDADSICHLFLGDYPPVKEKDYWCDIQGKAILFDDEIPRGINPHWEDESPIEVAIIINKL